MKKVIPLALGLLLTVWAGGAFAADKAKSMVAQGKVTAATNESLTIEDGSKTSCSWWTRRRSWSGKA